MNWVAVMLTDWCSASWTLHPNIWSPPTSTQTTSPTSCTISFSTISTPWFSTNSALHMIILWPYDHHFQSQPSSPPLLVPYPCTLTHTHTYRHTHKHTHLSSVTSPNLPVTNLVPDPLTPHAARSSCDILSSAPSSIYTSLTIIISLHLHLALNWHYPALHHTPPIIFLDIQ